VQADVATRVVSSSDGQLPAMSSASAPFTGFLAALAALPPLSIDMGLPGIPSIEASFPTSGGHGALTLSLFLAGFAISPLACGPLADRFGRRAILAFGLLLFTLAATASALSGSFQTLLWCRLVQGVAAGACVIMPLTIVRDVFEGATARHHLSRITAVMGVAPMLAPLLGGWVMSFGGWRGIYGAQALCGAALLLVTLLLFRETLPTARRRRLDPASLVAGYRMVLGNRAFCGHALLYAFTFACMFSFISSAPAVLMGRMGLNPALFAVVFGVTCCGTLVGSIISGRLAARKIASRTLLGGSLATMSAAVLCVLLMTLTGAAQVLTIMAPVALAILCFGVIGPSANHEALVGLPHVAGSASGALRCLQMAIGALASTLVAFLQPLGQPVLVMASLMTATTLAAALTLLWLRCQPRSHRIIQEHRS